LVLALVAWHRHLAARRRAHLGQRHIDGLSRHLLKDIGLSRRSEIGGRD